MKNKPIRPCLSCEKEKYCPLAGTEWTKHYCKDYKSPMDKDNVNHPAHYTQGNIECIDAMESAFGTEAVYHFCMCNAFKYQWRFNHKNGEEDIKKCQWYQNKMLELKNKLNNGNL